jgi:hypothetical protein
VLAAYARRDPRPMLQMPRWRQAATDDSPQSVSSTAFMTKPSNSWPGGVGAESPQSATAAQVWSPYESQRASPVGAEMGGRAQWASVPIPRPYRRDSVGVLAGRVGEGEQIEMSPLGEGEGEGVAGKVGFVPAPAPTIGHPGHGRKESFGEVI